MVQLAIVGMSGRFQDASNVNDLFNNLLAGKHLIKRLSKSEENRSKFHKSKGFVPVYSEIPDANYLDNNIFKLSVKESKLTDPQQRIFLKCCYEAIEDAGYSTQSYTGDIGVFGSTEFSSYLLNNIKGSEYDTKGFDYLTFIGNEPDFLSTRVSYKLGLTGPSMSIQSGCSSTFAALSVASNYLELNKCDMALVGGVSLQYPSKQGYVYKKGSTFSKNGEVRPFDSEATGMVKGDGCGVVLIKKLEDAIRDRDNIYCTIEGIGINNDGNRKVGYTAPSIKGETEVLKKAISNAKLLEQPKYIETHGTGTYLGDPVEITALNKAYNFRHEQLIGSVKANLGHLDTASGITGLIKAALILKKGIIPKSINFNNINPQVKTVPVKLETNRNVSIDCEEDNYVSVSSFGIGGTNGHVILKNYRSNNQRVLGKENDFLIPISAETLRSLNGYEERLINYLEVTKDNIYDIAYTLTFGRNSYKYRRVYEANSVQDLLNKLKKRDYYDCDSNSKYSDWLENKVLKFPVSESSFNHAMKVSLPTYSFDESKYIITPTNIQQVEKSSSHAKTVSLANICSVWSSVLGEDVTPDMNFFDDLDGDSLLAIDLISELENKFNVNINNDALVQYNTPRKMYDGIFNDLKDSQKYHMNNIQMIKFDTLNKFSIVLIHPAGGTTYCFNNLVKYINKANIYTVSCPKQYEKKEIDYLASVYKEELKDKGLLNKSTILVGYSFGGNVALKIAEEFQELKAVWLIDTYPPESYTSSNLDDKEYQKVFPEIWLSMTGKINELTQDLRNKLEGKSIESIVYILKQEKLINQEFSDNEIIDLFNMWCNHHRALGKQTLTSVNVDTVLFSAKESMPEYMYKYTAMKKTPLKVWKNYMTKSFKIIRIPGNHYSIMDNLENVQWLAKAMNKLILNYAK